MTASLKRSDIYIQISQEAAIIANEDDRLSSLAWHGDIFQASNSSTKIALDYNQRDILSTTKDPNILDTLDQIAYDAIYKAIGDNLENTQSNDTPLLSLIFEDMRTNNGQ